MKPEDIKKFRFSFSGHGPALDDDDMRNPKYDERYANIPDGVLPKEESLKDTMVRIIPFWNNTIAKNGFNNKQILIVGHKNSLRALFKHL